MSIWAVYARSAAVVQKEDLSRLAFDPRFTPEALARAFEDEEGEEEDDFGRDPW